MNSRAHGHINKSVSCYFIFDPFCTTIYSNLFIPSINALGLYWWIISIADHSLIKYWPGVDSVISSAFGDCRQGIIFTLCYMWMHKARLCVQLYLLRYLFWCLVLLTTPALFCVIVDVWFCVAHINFKCLIEGITPKWPFIQSIM